MNARTQSPDRVRVCLAGDVMTGRGIDQILSQPSRPQLHEPYVHDARDYVALAEQRSGPIPRGVVPSYIWGDALPELERHAPVLRIVNLETSVTRSDAYWPGKDIHYRMHPDNIACLTAAHIDCCVLANNHVFDWGYDGLAETLASLANAGIVAVGAGRDGAMAARPALLPFGSQGRVLVFAFGASSSGIPQSWAARAGRAGVALLPDLSSGTADVIARTVHATRRAQDLVVISIHWGGNWGYTVPLEHRSFAHALIDAGAADVVHGHSSHHPQAIEVYRERPILYGCGDLLNDYEGIRGYERYRGDLSLLYLVTLSAASGRLVSLEMLPMQTRGMCLRRPSEADTEWLAGTLAREARNFGGDVTMTADGWLSWQPRN
jgi:poly-gamma-glutamate capsule biosynthesis protein CapA/YwtB (metallophosphatase superfamily)